MHMGTKKELLLAFRHMNKNKLLVHCSERKGNGEHGEDPENWAFVWFKSGEIMFI